MDLEEIKGYKETKALLEIKETEVYKDSKMLVYKDSKVIKEVEVIKVMMGLKVHKVTKDKMA